MRSMAVFVKGGEYMDVAKHLYSDSDINRIKAERQQIEEEASALRRLDMFRRIAKRFD